MANAHHRFSHTLIAFLLTASTGYSKNRYQKWMDEEVKWIASSEESRAFAQLFRDSEREEFVRRFWKRRDPTPESERNEYKEEYYRRWQYVNAHFHEGIPGWRTDRGRVYLLHGEPDREETLTIDGSGVEGTRTSIVWTYFSLPLARYYQGRLLLVFQPNIGSTEQDFTLGESKMARQKARQMWVRSGVRASELIDTAVRYRLVAAGPPAMLSSRGTDMPASGIGEYARHVEDLLRPHGESIEELEKEQKSRLASLNQLREHITTAVSFGGLPLHMTCQDFHSPETVTTAIAWQLPLSALDFKQSDQGREAKLDLVAQVRTLEGTVVDESFKTIELRYTERDWLQMRDEDFRYVNEFRLPYGRYEIVSIARDAHSGRVGSASREMVSQLPETGKISLSGLVLSRSVAAPQTLGFSEELLTDQWQVIPEADGQFSPLDKLLLYFKVYNARPASDGSPSVVISYDFYRQDKVVRTSGPRKVLHYTEPAQQTIAYTSILDLSTFPPGTYHLQVTAIDFNTKHYALRRAQFEIQ